MDQWATLLVRRLSSIESLLPQDVRLIADLPVRLATFFDNQEIVRQGTEPENSFMVIDGLVANVKLCHGGRIQIPSFYVPGDLPDLQNLHLSRTDSGFRALSPAQVAIVPHAALNAACSRSQTLTRTLWRLTLVDAAIYREWVTNIGRRSALERVAHLFCELFVRLRTIGRVDGFSYALPITQEELSNAAGISVIHANRVLQHLRQLDLITFDRGRLDILNWEELRHLADFDAAYLHLLPDSEDIALTA